MFQGSYLIRIGLAFVFAFFCIAQLMDPAFYASYLPLFIQQYGSATTLVYANAAGATLTANANAPTAAANSATAYRRSARPQALARKARIRWVENSWDSAWSMARRYHAITTEMATWLTAAIGVR